MMKNFLKNMFYGLAAALFIIVMFGAIFFLLVVILNVFHVYGVNFLVLAILSALITGIVLTGILKETRKRVKTKCLSQS